jgi:selenocysteine lyase/cysteine desulfurase
VRASPHAYNTEDELDRFIDAVAGLGGGTCDG